MRRTVLSDTSCIILLHKLGKLDLLQKLFGTVYTTPEVATEFGKPLPAWFEIRYALDHDYRSLADKVLDKGEASAIALALETENVLLIIDELKGRKVAAELGIPIVGTLGIILLAKQAGIIASVKPLLVEISKTNFRLTAALEASILTQAGES